MNRMAGERRMRACIRLSSFRLWICNWKADGKTGRNRLNVFIAT